MSFVVMNEEIAVSTTKVSLSLDDNYQRELLYKGCNFSIIY